MHPPHKLGMLRHILNYTGIHALSKILPIAGILVFSFFLTPEELGLISLHLATIWILAIFLSANMYSGIGRFLFDPTVDNAELLGTALIVMLATAVVGGVVWLLVLGPLEQITHLPRQALVLQIPIALGLVAESTLTQVSIYQQQSQRLLAVIATKSTLLVAVAIFGITTLDTNRFMAVIYADVVASLFILLTSAWVIGPLVRLRFSQTTLKALSSYSLPLILYAISLAALSQIDRIFIANMLDVSQVGIYNLSYTIGIAALMLTIPVLNAFQPRFFRYMNNKEPDKVADDAIILLLLFSAVSAVIACLAPMIANYIFAQSYQSGFIIIPIVAAGSLAQIFYIIWARTILFYNRTILNSLVIIFSLAVNVSLNIMMIPKFGIIGAAISTAIAQLSMAISLQALLSYFQLPRQSYNTNLSVAFTSLLIWILTSIKLNFIYNIWAQIVFLTILCAFLFYSASLIVNEKRKPLR